MSTDSSKDAYYDACAHTANWLKDKGHTPEIALVLGSGLGGMAETFEDRVAFPYEEIPNFPVSTVEGHAGQLVFGTLHGRSVVAMQGRFHYYEGWSQQEVTFPIRVFALMGAKTLIVTNSSGGINPDFRPGDLMIINDHLNLTGQNPLRGHNDNRFGPRFPDMTDAYNFDLRTQAMAIAKEVDVELHTGVYSGLAGPTYETPAEIRMLRRLGGDAVGMSTVPEVIVANHSGMQVLGISCITNMAAGLSETKLNHEEVTTNAKLARTRFTTLVDRLIADLKLPS